MITIRPGTYADMKAVDGMPPSRSARCQAAEEDGEVVAIWGIYPQNTRYVMFSHLSPRFRENKRNFIVGIAAIKSLIASRPSMPVLAIADPEIEGSEILLEHMGFVHIIGRTYQWHGPQPPQA